MAIKALIYCRVSSVQQKVDGHGLDSQEHRCRDYAARKGYMVEKVFRDSISGGGDFLKRPDLAEMLAYMDERPHQKYIIIFDDLKRFARDTVFHWKLRKELDARGAKPECLNFNFEDTPEGEFIETILAAQGQLERQQNRRQVVQKMKARLERGYWPFYPPPGYVGAKDAIHGKLLNPVEPEASVLKEALEQFAFGRLENQIDVLSFLKQRGIKMSLQGVNRFLNRVIYAGYIEYPEWEVSRRKGHHQGIISLEIFEKIQERLHGKLKNLTRKDTNPDFPLRRFVLCSKCQHPYTAAWSTGRKEKYPLYRCNNKYCAEYSKSVRRIEIETRFIEILKKIKPKEATLKLTKAILLDVWNKKLSELEVSKRNHIDEVSKIDAEITGLLTRASKATNEQVAHAYEAQVERLSNQKLLLQERLSSVAQSRIDFETALDKVFTLLKNPYIKWDRGGIDDKRLVLKLVFAEKLVYDREKGFETAVLALPLRVFELNSAPKFQLVEVVEVESTSEKRVKRG